jgi:hypothetical protein
MGSQEGKVGGDEGECWYSSLKNESSKGLAEAQVAGSAYSEMMLDVVLPPLRVRQS